MKYNKWLRLESCKICKRAFNKVDLDIKRTCKDCRDEAERCKQRAKEQKLKEKLKKKPAEEDTAIPKGFHVDKYRSNRNSRLAFICNHFGLTPVELFERYKRCLASHTHNHRDKTHDLSFEKYINLFATGKCAYCGRKVSAKTACVDRVINKFGLNDNNVVLSCSSCNLLKSNLTLQQLEYIQGIVINRMIAEMLKREDF